MAVNANIYMYTTAILAVVVVMMGIVILSGLGSKGSVQSTTASSTPITTSQQTTSLQSTTVQTTAATTTAKSTISTATTTLTTTVPSNVTTTASQITGNERIAIANGSAYNISMSQGGESTVKFNLILVNGYYSYATTVAIANQSLLTSNGITLLLTNNTGNPPFTGTLYVFAAHNATLGKYNVVLTGQGNSYVTVKTATVHLTVTT
ncbi:MAG: hypothetical protein KGH72_04805 [Candidatus Micrarchaeota archaeon]|nr:hypothetical protein [Candidatus Micrarchaeota archaeon]